MKTLPLNWVLALHAICEASTPQLQEAVFLHSPIGWKRRVAVKLRYKRPSLIVQCFGFWLDGQQPIPNCPLANAKSAGTDASKKTL